MFNEQAIVNGGKSLRITRLKVTCPSVIVNNCLLLYGQKVEAWKFSRHNVEF